jgi:glycosyltransferase involved in cell wall biosynthesis
MYIAHISTAITLNQTVLNRMVYQKKNGHRVVALCPENEWTADLKAQDVEVFEVPFIRHNLQHSFTTAALRTYWVCRREQFDIVHTHTLLPGIAGRVAARLAGIPVVVHTFHSWPLHKPRGKGFTLAYKTLEVLAAYFGHVILFQNGDDLRSWGQIPGMPKHKAILIGNGIDSQAILSKVQPGARESVRREFGVDDNATLIVMVARLELYKGHLMLLQALRQIVSSTQHKIAALFVGIGKDRPQIEEESNRLGLNEVVQFTGYRLDVPNILCASDISVLTSRYEGIPRALMESMVLGIPVIATDVPGSRTLIRSGENGVLVTHNDAPQLAAVIRYLIENPGTAGQLAACGRQTVLKKYDEYQVAARVEEIYRQILDTGIARLPDWNLGADL